MEINDLRIFQMVAKEESISKAALKLGYAQSNISMRIKVLENELKTPLFIRNNKGITINSEGKKLLEYAEKIIKLVEEATEEFNVSKIKPSLKIGATQTISASRIPKLFALFYEKNPGVSLVLKTEKQEVLLESLAEDYIDGAFIHGEHINSKFKEVFSFKEEVVLISSKDIDYATKPIIVNTDNSCPYRSLVGKWANENSFKPTAIIEFDTLEAILNGVTEGLGASLLPRSVLPKDHNFYVYDSKTLTIKFVVNRNKKLDHSLKSFIDIAKEYIEMKR